MDAFAIAFPQAGVCDKAYLAACNVFGDKAEDENQMRVLESFVFSDGDSNIYVSLIFALTAVTFSISQ